MLFGVYSPALLSLNSHPWYYVPYGALQVFGGAVARNAVRGLMPTFRHVCVCVLSRFDSIDLPCPCRYVTQNQRTEC